MNKKIILLLLFLVEVVFGQTKIINENIERNKLTLRFETSVNYKIKLNENKRIFSLNNYQDESSPGDVKLPSSSIFISLPIVENPKINFSILSKKEIKAIPEFNEEVELSSKKEILYSNAKNLKNSKVSHYLVKGYLWIEGSYCLHLEVIPSIFVSSKNIIEIMEQFEIELTFENLINSSQLVKTNSNKNKIITNSIYNIQGEKDKFYYQNNDSWIDYSKKYVKIGTAEDGIYRIYKSNLEVLGLNTSIINPRTFRLLLKGAEIPIYVKGESDLIFNSEDFIEFVGLRNMGGAHREVSGYDKPYNEYLGRYTDTTTYWLTWEGVNGKRVQLSSGDEVQPTDTLNYYSQIEHYEKNNWFDFSCASLVRRETPYWIENKTWNEGGIGVGTRNKSFSVSNLKLDGKARLFVKLQDWVSDITNNAHLYALSVNSDPNFYDSTFVDKYEKAIIQTEISSNLLEEGNNTLKLHSFVTAATINNSFLDWYEVEYPRYLVPIEGRLNFKFSTLNIPEVKTLKIQSVLNAKFSLWQYGEVYKKYTLVKFDDNVIFADTVSLKSRFAFTEDTKVLSPKFYYLKQFPNLRDSQNRADYIAITHDKFETKVSEYNSFISTNYELATKVINVNDIYDEYSYGFFNPEVIKDFLKSTHEYWQEPKPQSVILIGGATYDYHGNKSISTGIERVLNYVPSFGASASDNWFVSWDTTGAFFQQMNIGRLPVTTSEEFDWYFEKHQNYLTQESDDWNKRYLFFSGGNEKNQSEMDQLRESNQYVVDNFVSQSPIGGKVEHFYKTNNPQTNFGPYSAEYIQDAIEAGAVFISYIGHSGTQTWDNSITNPTQLMNGRNRSPLVSDFGCSTGRFAEPDIISFSQLFTIGDKGQALTYIGNSSLGFLSTSVLMPKLFYNKILKENILTVSEAHKLAKIEMLQTNGYSGVYELFTLTNSLIGDPLITLPIPIRPNFIISNEGINLNSSLLTDLQDSLEITINFNNYGAVKSDNFEILMIHQYLSNTDSIYSIIDIPNFIDTIVIKVGIRNKVGSHTINVFLDPNNKLEEIYEDDNNAQISFNVASSSIRPLLQYQITNGINKNINLINPTSKVDEETIILDISEESNFNSFVSNEIGFDSLVSRFSTNDLDPDQRFWGRTKIKGSNDYSIPFSFYSRGERYFLNDSLSFTKSTLNSTSINENIIKVDSSKVKFELFSAGFYDGNTVLIKKDDVNYTFDGTLRGHYITLFEDSTYQFVSSILFDVPFGGQDVIDAYNMFLDTVSVKYLVMFSIKDDGGSNLTSELKSKIKNFGSVYIDSVKSWSSWALIGKKGAINGRMPEAFALRGNGPVSIDTTISFLSDKGSLITTDIGPVGKWDNLVVDQETPSNSNIIYTPIGYKFDGQLDTLAQLTIQNSVADISFIDSKEYPKLKILSNFQASDDNQSPILHSLGVDYDGVPELAINYQVVSVEKDTLEQGEDANLLFYVYNVGESRADSFNVTVDVINPDNSRQKIFETIIDTLGSEQRKKFNIAHQTSSFNGERSFAISIDSEDKVLELYEDNNFYNIPFFVKGDTTRPSLNLTIDGNNIFDGEYISNTPQILVELSDPSLVPIDDTASVRMYLNNQYIPYFGTSENLDISYSATNPKVTVNYNPSLEDGEYTLRIFGKDASGNVSDSAGISKTFNIQSDAKLLNVYNYPNPFSSDTYFTFKLTQIPDEIKIKVFTVAGRLIKELELNSSQLNYDLNKIYWDGRDEEGDLLGNGVYLYKVIMDVEGKKQDVTQKMAVVR